MKYDDDYFSDWGENQHDCDWRKNALEDDMFSSEYGHLLSQGGWMIVVNDLLSMDPDYIRKFGIPVTGNRREDMRAENRSAYIGVSINAIAGYILDGLSIKILEEDHDQLPMMHDIITGYLREWVDYIENDPASIVGEYSDYLKALDMLNRYIFELLTLADKESNVKQAEKRFGLTITDFGGYNESQRSVTRLDYEDKFGRFSKIIRNRIERERT